MLHEIPEEYMKQFEDSMKIGLISTVTPDGHPHITFISTIQANTPKQIIWGQFIEGISKENVKLNPKTGFLIMNQQKELWRGKALWTHIKKEGPEYTMYNNKPLYRYNSYCGIHTVHFMDLVEITEKSKLNLGSIGIGAVNTKISKGRWKTNKKEIILKPWSESLFDKIDSLKFLSYIDDDGFPKIIPIIQAQASDNTRIVFSTSPYKKELAKIHPGTKVAIFCMNLNMENVLVYGIYSKLGNSASGVDIDMIYNSMPPKHGYIYPKEDLQPVSEFN